MIGHLDVDSRVHLVGVGGAGMSGIARILLQRGIAVSGSDLREGRALDALRALGARIEVGHRADNVGDATIVVTSTAVPVDNPEVADARSRGLPVLRRAEMLAQLMADEQAVLVAGTHGKTTTTSMTVVALQSAGGDPSFAIGGSLNESGTNAHAGTDGRFVAEADESDRSFLVYRPDVALVTNVEHEHPEEYADVDAVREAFLGFLDRRAVGAPAVLCLDDPGSAGLVGAIDEPVVTYGTDPRADVRVLPGDDGEHHLWIGGEEIARFGVGIPGLHNVRNAAGALAICHVLGLDVAAAAVGLARFTGAARRFQHLGTAAGVEVIDDYAHHPTELRATLAAARTVHDGRIVLVVQPHRYSRTERFGAELGRAAAAADQVIVSDVYGASESPVPGVTGALVADAAAAAGASVRYEPHLGDLVPSLRAMVQPGDLVLVTGAGDVTLVGPALLDALGTTS
ncbi:MAG: UDP-N-acetylmuramate--L-alanine ligase [Nitriliruptoraceae bacterium]|nr:UDP-N-acetylmuramate--L-alanine ligase [Nitriliruptoraceae bacterium]